MNIVVFLGFALIASLAGTDALGWLPCNKVKCRSFIILIRHCKGGLTNDVGGCCKTCAKVEGESCGGPWGIEGSCDVGLYCNKKDDFNAVGRCVKVSRCGAPRKSKSVKIMTYHWEYLSKMLLFGVVLFLLLFFFCNPLHTFHV